MISHHPKMELLIQHVNGELPASISAAIKMHSDVCTQCKEQIDQLTKHQAQLSFSDVDAKEAEFEFNSADMLENIMQMEPEQDIDTSLLFDEKNQQTNKNASVNFRGVDYSLPSVMNKMQLGKSAQIGKLTRARVLLDEGHIHSSLLKIEAGGSIPEHTHKGFEITLLLEGSFNDDMGEYVAGDFIQLDGQHLHQPISEQGCLCYTVVSDSLHFTQGINKLLNPIGSFIY